MSIYIYIYIYILFTKFPKYRQNDSISWEERVKTSIMEIPNEFNDTSYNKYGIDGIDKSMLAEWNYKVISKPHE